jgi:hypothetical protein
MYGVKEETPEQIYLSNEANIDQDHLIKKTVTSWLGDGTVLDYSAMMDNDPRIIEQVKAALVERAPPENISAAPLATCSTSEGPLEIDGATLNGSERVLVPEQELSMTLSVRTSKPIQNLPVLRTLEVDGLMVSSGASAAVKFDPVDQPRFDRERAEGGGVIDFYTQKFAATFHAPTEIGDAKIEFRCDGKQKEAVASWDFKVTP